MWGKTHRASSAHREELGHPLSGVAGGRSRPERQEYHQAGWSARDRRRSCPAAAFQSQVVARRLPARARPR